MTAIALTPEKFAAAAERLPTTPQIFSRLSSAMKNPDISVEEIVSVVQLDASLSARVLRLSNSAQYGRGGSVADLTEAINRTGFQEVYRLVGAAMSSQLYITGLPVYGIGGDELWSNSLTAAVALEHLSDATGEDRRVGYTLGLLRSVGRLLLQRLAAGALVPPLSGRKATAVLVDAWERETFGITSAEAAERLFALWRFPARLADPIQFQFKPSAAPQRVRFAALLHIAGYIAEKLDRSIPIEKNAWALDEEILLMAGLDADAVESCLEKTRSGAGQMESMMRAA
ncbi:MAG: HDOD domain-containing protein [Nibricoccus sp.]